MANLATGKAIKTWIRIRGTTMRALADDMGVSVQSLSKWINTGDIPPYALDRLSRSLRVPAKELTGG